MITTHNSKFPSKISEEEANVEESNIDAIFPPREN